jgi:hypothetical protein
MPLTFEADITGNIILPQIYIMVDFCWAYTYDKEEMDSIWKNKKKSESVCHG